jgi:hypothetical protein
MVEETKPPNEIARMIKEQAYVLFDPWPVDLQSIILSTTFGWRAMQCIESIGDRRSFRRPGRFIILTQKGRTAAPEHSR